MGGVEKRPEEYTPAKGKGRKNKSTIVEKMKAWRARNHMSLEKKRRRVFAKRSSRCVKDSSPKEWEQATFENKGVKEVKRGQNILKSNVA